MEYYYDQNTGMTPKPPKKDSDIGAWIGIAVLFAIGLWPIGLIVLISKLSDRNGNKKEKVEGKTSDQKAQSAYRKVTRTPQYGAKGAAGLKWGGLALMILGAVGLIQAIGGSGLFYSDILQVAWSDLSYAIGFMAGGGAMMLGGRNMQERARRFGKYLAVAGSDKAISLQRLSRSAEVSEKRLERDLEIMVEKRLWGEEAYVDRGAGMLFRTHEAAMQYDARTTAQQHTAPAEAEQGYSGVLRQIRAANDRIADPVLSRKIDRLEEIAGRIFRIIEEEPEKKAKAATFLNYYLPTTQKLLDSYAEFEEAGISGTNLDQAKSKIQHTMDNIVQGFEHQLDELYQADAMDIDSDIRVMETMLRRDNATVSDDFGLGNVARATEEE